MNATVPGEESFSSRLASRISQVGTPVMVGLDPRVESLPPGLIAPEDTLSPAAIAAAYKQFCVGVLDAIEGRVAVVKPQMAFFEEIGPAGYAALLEIVQEARRRGFLVVLDGKRNDIGSTAEAYAKAYLGAGSLFHGDALTVSPYLGDDSLAPFIARASACGAGLFVLVKTSNPGGALFQDLLIEGEPLYRRVAALVQAEAERTKCASGYGAVGAVVGATYPQQLGELRQAMPSAWLLVPGYGAQGAGAKDVADAFDERGLGAVINSSRGVIFAHLRREHQGRANWQDAVAAAADEMIAELQAETRAGRLMSGRAR